MRKKKIKMNFFQKGHEGNYLVVYIELHGKYRRNSTFTRLKLGVLFQIFELGCLQNSFKKKKKVRSTCQSCRLIYNCFVYLKFQETVLYSFFPVIYPKILMLWIWGAEELNFLGVYISIPFPSFLLVLSLSFSSFLSPLLSSWPSAFPFFFRNSCITKTSVANKIEKFTRWALMGSL